LPSNASPGSTPDGTPCWTAGELLVDSIYRFKGQSASGVVLSELDFDALTDIERRKLFVGLTRAHLAVELVLSPAPRPAWPGRWGRLVRRSRGGPRRHPRSRQPSIRVVHGQRHRRVFGRVVLPVAHDIDEPLPVSGSVLQQ
jgi:hypothetical protein